MKKLMNILLLSCQKATLLIEKEINNPLSFKDKLQLNMHLKMCRKCSEYKKQSVLIENVLKAHHKKISTDNHFILSESSKSRIQKSIDEHLK